jgi:hypothetical protein
MSEVDPEKCRLSPTLVVLEDSGRKLVELRRIELPTFALRTRRSPS